MTACVEHQGYTLPNGVTALAKEYGCDTNVIYKIVRGTYVVGSR